MCPNWMQCSRAACNDRSGSHTACATSSEESTCDDKWGTDVSVRPTRSAHGTCGDSNKPYVSPLLQVPCITFDLHSKEHYRDRTAAFHRIVLPPCNSSAAYRTHCSQPSSGEYRDILRRGSWEEDKAEPDESIQNIGQDFQRLSN